VLNPSQNHIIWLASYPKSGNTWVRIFLQHILKHNNDDFENLNLEDIPIASNRKLIDRFLGVASADMTPEEILHYRPEVYRALAARLTGPQIIKVHDAYGATNDGYHIFPADVTRAAIYITRNPLDLVVSYSFHSGKSIQTIVDQLNNPSFEISRSENALKPQVAQHLGTWSQHVLSWTSQQHFPVINITFEQLLENSSKVFRELLERLKIPFTDEGFRKALLACDFTHLQEQEESNGFREKPLQAKSFFREGKRDIYKKHLSREQILSIIDNHKDIMSKFGYLPDL
jgi:aryl sulfotransferase